MVVIADELTAMMRDNKHYYLISCSMIHAADYVAAVAVEMSPRCISDVVQDLISHLQPKKIIQ